MTLLLQREETMLRREGESSTTRIEAIMYYLAVYWVGN
jgi:hypothetical protein